MNEMGFSSIAIDPSQAGDGYLGAKGRVPRRLELDAARAQPAKALSLAAAVENINQPCCDDAPGAQHVLMFLRILERCHDTDDDDTALIAGIGISRFTLAYSNVLKNIGLVRSMF
jgi:hypothetical protein